VAPFDRILAAAAAAEVPANLADQLAEGGVMITPVGTRRDDQRLVRVTRDASGFKTEEMVRVHFVPLVPSVGEADNGSEHRPESGPESAVPGTAPPSRSEGGAQ
jgi:protein-L-isoaspartate O-methyltransferase